MRVDVPYLTRRGDAYGFRMAVPMRWRIKMGCTDVRFSLRTKSFALAKQRCRLASNYMEALFLKLDTMPNLTRERINQMLRQYFQTLYTTRVDAAAFHDEYERTDALEIAIDDSVALNTRQRDVYIADHDDARLNALCQQHGVAADRLASTDRAALVNGIPARQ